MGTGARPGVLAVGADAADDRGQVDHDVGFRRGEESFGVGLTPQFAASSRSTTNDPRKPEPPVTITRRPCQKVSVPMDGSVAIAARG